MLVRQRLQNIVHGGFLGPQLDLVSLRRLALVQPCLGRLWHVLHLVARGPDERAPGILAAVDDRLGIAPVSAGSRAARSTARSSARWSSSVSSLIAFGLKLHPLIIGLRFDFRHLGRQRRPRDRIQSKRPAKHVDGAGGVADHVCSLFAVRARQVSGALIPLNYRNFARHFKRDFLIRQL